MQLNATYKAKQLIYGFSTVRPISSGAIVNDG